MKLTNLVALATIVFAVSAPAVAQDIVFPTGGLKGKFSEKDLKEFRDAKNDFAGTKRFNDFKRNPSRRTADRVRDSENYANYIRWYWQVRLNPIGHDMPRRERDFYNDLQRMLRRELGGRGFRIDD